MEKVNEYETVIALNVDVQNDFCPGGALAVENGDEVVEPLNEVNRWVRAENGLVVFTRDWHPPVTNHFENWPPHCVQYKAGAAFHNDLEIVNGSETFYDGHDLIASKGMGVREDAYSGLDARVFWGTTDRFAASPGMDEGKLKKFLHEYISGQYFKRTETASRFPAHQGFEKAAILVGGLATDYCVKATVLDALKFKAEEEKYPGRRIGVYVLKNAVRAVNIQPDDGKKAIIEMEATGASFISSDELIAG